MADSQKLLQGLSDEFQTLQNDLNLAVEARRKLESQLQENKSVQKEFSGLDDDANIYKLVGPVLLKQDKVEAKMNVDKRLEFIESEIKRIEAQIADLTSKQEKKKIEVMQLQQLQQQAAQAFAGLMISQHGMTGRNFPVSRFISNSSIPRGSGNNLHNNDVQGGGKLYFCMEFGARPWTDQDPAVESGDVSVNKIGGCVVNVNIDAARLALYRNTYSATAGQFAHCSRPAALLNISPESRVDRQAESSPPALHTSYTGCVPQCSLH